MARLSDLQRGAGAVDAKTKHFAASTLLLDTLDSFVLKKTEKDIKLTAYLGVFKQDFQCDDMCKLAQPLGQWLCSLPKGVWNDKIK